MVDLTNGPGKGPEVEVKQSAHMCCECYSANGQVSSEPTLGRARGRRKKNLFLADKISLLQVITACRCNTNSNCD